MQAIRYPLALLFGIALCAAAQTATTAASAKLGGVWMAKLDLVFACYGGNYSDPALYIPQRVYVPKYILPAVAAGR